MGTNFRPKGVFQLAHLLRLDMIRHGGVVRVAAVRHARKLARVKVLRLPGWLWPRVDPRQVGR